MNVNYVEQKPEDLEYVAIAEEGEIANGERIIVEEFEVACPRHGAHFDVRDGRALTLPAVVDIPAYPVRVSDGQVEVGVPKED